MRTMKEKKNPPYTPRGVTLGTWPKPAGTMAVQARGNRLPTRRELQRTALDLLP